MGYDNECIVNIQSLPGEYFCPVCRTLVNPNEALQAQCTHLYCKPCLAYLVATTPACPYDGYLVTEADSKPLTESSKELAETIGKVAVYCLYHRSNCQWQGTLAESNTHCAGCTFGNSPVVCNRCGTQIVHRQVQEHAQICPGVQPQAQIAENSQAQATQDPSSAASAATVAAATSAPAATAAAPAAPAKAAASTPASSGPTPIPAAATPAASQAAAQAPTPEQWYQQQQLQYQQYYQQYPGYDAYQQQYQQYAQYQQQTYPQYAQPQMQAMAPGQQPQPYVQQPQPQPGQSQFQAQPQHLAQPLQQPQPQHQPHLSQPQAQPQPHPHPQPQAQPQPHVPAQAPQMQPFVPPHQPHPNAPPQSLPPPPQPHATQARPPQMQAPPQQMPHPQAYPQHQPRPQHPPQTHLLPQQTLTQMQPQPQPHLHSQMQPTQPPAHPVSGYQSYPQPTPGAPQQRPMHMHPQHPSQSQGQFPPQPPQMRPSHSQMMVPAQQQPGMPPTQGPPANLLPVQQQAQHPIHQTQQVYPQYGFSQAQAQVPMHSGQQPQQVPPQHQVFPQQSLRPQESAYMQQPAPGYPHVQGLPPHQAQARPMMAGQGMPQQPVPQSPVTGSNLMQPTMNQHTLNQNYIGRANQSGPIQQSQAPHTGKQGAASPATPRQEDGSVVKNAEGTKSGEKSAERVFDSMSKSNEEKAAANAKDKDSQAENEYKDVSEMTAKEEIVDRQLVKKEEDTNLLGGLTEGSDSRKGQEGKFDDKSSVQFKGENVPNGQNAGNVSNMPQQMQVPHVLNRGQLQQQSAEQSAFPTQGHGFPPAGQGMPPGPPKHIPYGHQPRMSDPGMISQRPPAPDGMFQQPMHQCDQGRFPEPSPHVHGQAMVSSHMRPPGHNVHETFPQQRQMPVSQDAFWPPPHAGAPGSRLPPPPPPPGSAPNHHGIPPKGFDQHAMAQPIMGGPPPGALDAPNRMMGGPSFPPDDKMGRSASASAMEAEGHASRRPRVYDGRKPDSHQPLPNEHASYGHPNAMKMNGMTNNSTVGGMRDSEDRFRPFPEGGFKAAQDEHFRPSSLEPSRHVNRREFEEDLKQFPRPAHLDGEGPPRFDGYSTSRPLDRMGPQSGGANALRPPSSYQSGASFPPNFGNSESTLDIAREHLGRRRDGTFPHPDRLNLVPEFGRHRGDGLPPLRSPGHFSRDMPDGLPSYLRRGLDGIGPVNHGFSNDMRGNEIMGSRGMPNFGGSGFGGFHNHPDIGETGGLGNFPSHVRMGDPGFNGRFSSAAREGNIDSFEQSRKRKAGGMVRCLICKIDCETVEGLEHHSQGREHQKKAMDMVLSIKKENAKKHRASANATTFEDANKPRKSGFDKRAKKI